MFGDRVENFLARQHDAHRPSGFLRQRHRDRFDFRINFAAVAAAEIRHDTRTLDTGTLKILASWVRTTKGFCVVAHTVMRPPGSTEAMQA